MTIKAKELFGAFRIQALAIACAGVVLFYRSFVTLRLGPLFILEWLYLFWVMAAFLEYGTQLVSRHLKIFVTLYWPIFVFFIYGLFRLAIDIFTADSDLPSIPILKTAQYALIFVYPFIWAFAGWLQARSSPSTIRSLVVLVFLLASVKWVIETIGTPLKLNLNGFFNQSIGPILILLPTFQFYKTFQQWNFAHIRKRWNNIFLLAIAILLSIFPLCWMWTTSVSRTTFGMLVFDIVILGFFFFRSQSFLKKISLTFGMLIVYLSVLLFGFFVTSEINKSPFRANLENAVVHSDDTVYIPPPDTWKDPRKEERKQEWFRTRRFLISQGIQDWLQSPLLGVGFVHNYPSWFRYNVKNEAGGGKDFLDLPELPVSSPHNSYLTILGRMGLLGFVIFLFCGRLFFVEFQRRFRNQHDRFISAFLILSVLNTALFSFFNVGLESPRNCLLAWIFTGILFALNSQQSKAANETYLVVPE